MKSGPEATPNYYSPRAALDDDVIVENQGTEYSVPHFWQRLLVFALVLVLLQLAFTPLGVLFPSERLLAAAPVLWLADVLYARRYLAWRNWDTSRRIYIFGAFIVAFVLMLVTFWSLLEWQARVLNGRVAFWEPFTRLYITLSLWLIFVTIYRWLAIGLAFGAVRVLGVSPLKARRWTMWAAAVLSFVLYLPYLFVALQIHRGKVGNAANPQQTLSLPYEEITLRASDGIKLRAWFIPRENSDTVVVVCHGVSANKGAFLKIVPFLHRAGFNILMFDFRGHGDSGGLTTSLGYYEARDVQAAVDYARQIPEIRRVVGYGFSMGAAGLLRASASTNDIQSVVVDSTFADMETLARGQFKNLPPDLNEFAMRVLNVYTRLSLGVPLDSIAPSDQIAKISPRPLLIIHGLADERVPPEQAQRNFSAAREPKQLWLVPDAAHVETYHQAGIGYEQRVIKALQSTLISEK